VSARFREQGDVPRDNDSTDGLFNGWPSPGHGRSERKCEIAFGGIERDDTRPWPDAVLQSKKSCAIGLAALQRIPLPRRAALVMHERDDVPVAEIAAVLALPRVTVYSRLRKARQELEAAIRRALRRGGVE
jgi:DNA-directed RNA polymerase specialized sigma24 family protein